MISSYKKVIRAEDVTLVQSDNGRGPRQTGASPGAFAVEQDTLALEHKINAMRDAAYKNGFADGSKEGHSEARERLTHAYAACETLLGELTAAKRELWKTSEKGILELAFAVAEKVIQREVSHDRGIVSTMLAKAIDHIQDKEEIRIRINPVDYTHIMAVKSETAENAVVPKNVVFEKDEGIIPGGAVVETRSIMVDARIDQQLQALMEALIS